MKLHSFGIRTSIHFGEGWEHSSTHKRSITGSTSLNNGIGAVSLVFGEKVFHMDKAQE